MRRRVPLLLLVAGCASSRWANGVRLETAGDASGAAEAYAECAAKDRLLDCSVRLAQFYRPGGPLADCARFLSLAAEVKERHGRDEAYRGAHAQEHLAVPYPAAWNVESVADWFGHIDRDCRLRSDERAESRDFRRSGVIDHSCPRHTEEDVERLDAKAAARIAAECEAFRRDHLTDDGVDAQMDAAIARGLTVGALASVDEGFAAPCWERRALRPLCPPREKLVARLQARVKMLIAFGTAAERLRWAKHYIKRWPDGPDIEAMRALRERASIDLALEQEGPRRVELLEEFLRTWPESPLRDEAEREVAKARAKQER